MSTTDAESDADALGASGAHTDVTEVWPGRFALEIESGGSELSTTTTLALDADQLRALADQIDAALADAHRQ